MLGDGYTFGSRIHRGAYMTSGEGPQYARLLDAAGIPYCVSSGERLWHFEATTDRHLLAGNGERFHLDASGFPATHHRRRDFPVGHPVSLQIAEEYRALLDARGVQYTFLRNSAYHSFLALPGGEDLRSPSGEPYALLP